jgi:N-acetylglucosamine kinase-like BadF-type ATPase
MANPAVGEGVFVGVDSGGTRTNVEILLIDTDGSRRSSNYEVAASLSGALSPSLIPSVLRKILAPLEMRLDELASGTLSVYTWVSAAGFSPWTRDDYVAALDEVASTLSHGSLRHIGVGNDGVSLLLGMRADSVIIAGTGSNVLVRSTDGSLHQAGGQEWVASDYGSGFWIGLLAIRQAFRDFESSIDSVLIQRLRQVYGVRAEDDRALIAKLRDLGVGDQNMKKEIARFAASVCGAAERGDLAAQNIVKTGAEDLADVTALALRRNFSMEELGRGMRIVQCGSLLGNAFYRSAFESQIEMRLRSGVENKADISWQRIVTGASSAIRLAQDLASDSKELFKLDLRFRPAIVDL